MTRMFIFQSNRLLYSKSDARCLTTFAFTSEQLGCRGLQSQNTRQNDHYTRISMLILHKFIINIVTCQNHFRLDWVLFPPRGLTLSALQQTKRAKKAYTQRRR